MQLNRYASAKWDLSHLPNDQNIIVAQDQIKYTRRPQHQPQPTATHQGRRRTWIKWSLDDVASGEHIRWSLYRPGWSASVRRRTIALTSLFHSASYRTSSQTMRTQRIWHQHRLHQIASSSVDAKRGVSTCNVRAEVGIKGVFRREGDALPMPQ